MNYKDYQDARDAVWRLLIDLRISELSDEVERYLKFREKIGREIRQLPEDEEKILLEKRYISFKPWTVIADEMGYVRRHITRKHAEALQSFEKIHTEILKNVPKCP